jgi:hypothetical protein
MWLMDDPEALLAENRRLRSGSLVRAWVPEHFVIGHDGGEEIYVLDTGTEPYPVLVLSLESGELDTHSGSFDEFIEELADAYQEIEEDERRMNEAYRNKKWWQFWIRPYPPGNGS